ncbi:MAG: aminodeoxychorismate synthase component I, partial [Proteobacteria bacterium]|nr:aminodeoxychorismate synthase component I [Pseudomonadota bacterium]
VAAVEQVKAYLAAGDIYQANLTMATYAQVSGDPLALHRAVSQAQPVSFAAFIAAGDWCVSSHSPELFVARHGDQIEVRPMKGTAPRGRTTDEDDAAVLALQADPKSRAENLMIVDLERNDLSRLAQTGSVHVADLFEVSRYPTLLQMTSSVHARVAENQGLNDIIRAMFPCGSVTGAPKIRAMEIIRSLENKPRGVYTGAIGHIAPGGDMTFNVPIRTLVIDRTGSARFGVGSGIVADSDPVAEYDECLLKCAFLTDPKPAPALIETILWDRESGYWLLEGHLDRLALSARYFGYPFDAGDVDSILSLSAAVFPTDMDQRVRLLLSPSGSVSASAIALDVAGLRAQWQINPPTIVLSAERVNFADRFLFHKTTHRRRYDMALREAIAQGHWDALFFNERGEVTEGARSNIFVEKDGQLYTPPIECGLLPGVFRAHLLSSGSDSVRETSLEMADLRAADKVFLGNAIYGLIAVECEFGEFNFS